MVGLQLAELLKEAIEGNEDLTPIPLNPEILVGVGEVSIDWEVVAGPWAKAAGGGVEVLEARVNHQYISTRKTTTKTHHHQVQARVRSYYRYSRDANEVTLHLRPSP